MLLDQMLIECINNAINAGESDEYQLNALAHHWGRIGKVGEEFGEVMNALIGATGQNFRKGYYATWEDVLKELADVVIAAILAMAELQGDPDLTEKYLHLHVRKLYERIPDEHKIRPVDV